MRDRSEKVLKPRIIIIYTYAMYVCLCYGVTDQDITQAVADGHRDMQSIQEHLLAGTGCGGCRNFTAELLDQLNDDQLQNRAKAISYAV